MSLSLSSISQVERRARAHPLQDFVQVGEDVKAMIKEIQQFRTMM